MPPRGIGMPEFVQDLDAGEGRHEQRDPLRRREGERIGREAVPVATHEKQAEEPHGENDQHCRARRERNDQRPGRVEEAGGAQERDAQKQKQLQSLREGLAATFLRRPQQHLPLVRIGPVEQLVMRQETRERAQFALRDAMPARRLRSRADPARIAQMPMPEQRYGSALQRKITVADRIEEHPAGRAVEAGGPRRQHQIVPKGGQRHTLHIQSPKNCRAAAIGRPKR